MNTLWCFVISVPGLSRLVRDTNGVRRNITRSRLPISGPASPSDDSVSNLWQTKGELSATGETGVSHSCTHRVREGSGRATGAAKRGHERSSSTEAARLPNPDGRITAGVDDTEVTTATNADAAEGRRDVLGWEDWVGSRPRLHSGTSACFRETSGRPRRLSWDFRYLASETLRNVRRRAI